MFFKKKGGQTFSPASVTTKYKMNKKNRIIMWKDYLF